MITPVEILIFLVAVSLIVGYVLVIHRTLSGAAANDPNYDANAPRAATSRPAAPADGGGHGHQIRHA
jgi:hypothetical protein